MVRMAQKITHLKLVLNGELAEKFDQIKEKLGLKNNSEVLRFLIRSYDLEGGD